MEEIYKRADRVVVWLGPEADDSTHAMELMKSLASQAEIDRHTLAIKPSSVGADEPHWVDVNIELPYDERDWRALYSLLHRTWFERLWIRQEIGFSGTNAIVLCGTATIMWQDLRKANNLFMLTVSPQDVFSKQEQITFNRCTRHIDDMAQYRPSIPTWQTLGDAESSQCSNPREKVYANLSFIQDAAVDIGLQPNYTLFVSEVSFALRFSNSTNDWTYCITASYWTSVEICQVGLRIGQSAPGSLNLRRVMRSPL